MTVKHFIVFANKVKEIQDPYNKQVVLEFLLDVLLMFNSKFNSNKFKEWIDNS